MDINSNECILKMDKVKQDNAYDIYQITLDNHVSIQAGLCNIHFLVIQDNIVYSKLIENIYLGYDNFSAANKLFLMGEMTKEMKVICAKIEEYTKLNIQLYKDMREVKNLND